MASTDTSSEVCPNCGQPYSAHELEHDDDVGGMVLVCPFPVDENLGDASTSSLTYPFHQEYNVLND